MWRNYESSIKKTPPAKPSKILLSYWITMICTYPEYMWFNKKRIAQVFFPREFFIAWKYSEKLPARGRELMNCWFQKSPLAKLFKKVTPYWIMMSCTYPGLMVFNTKRIVQTVFLREYFYSIKLEWKCTLRIENWNLRN